MEGYLKYQSLFDNMPTGFALLKRVSSNQQRGHWKIIDMNQTFIKRYESIFSINYCALSENEFTSHNFKQYLNRVLETSIPASYKNLRLDENIICDISAAPAENNSIVLFFSEAKERNDLEQRIINKNTILNQLTDNMTLSIISFNNKGVISYVNELFVNTFINNGKGTKEYFGKSIHTIENVNFIIKSHVQSIIEGKTVFFEAPIIDSKDDSNNIQIRFYGIPVNFSGSESGGMIVCENINKYFISANKLEKQNQEYDFLIDNISSQVWYIYNIDSYGKANKPHADFLGISKDELDGQKIAAYWSEKESLELLDYYKKVWFGKSKKFLELLCYNSQGQRKLLSINSIPVINNSGETEYLICSAMDITEQRRNEDDMKQLIVALRLSNRLTDERSSEIMELNRQLAESEASLKEAIAAKDKFFSIIAHDLKSPFQGFLGLTNLLSSNISDMPENEIMELSQAMNESAQHLHKLLENLLHWSRVQRKAIEYNPENLNIKSIVDLNISIAISNALAKKIKLNNFINPEINCFADLNLINTVFRNLISNAVKFTPYGGLIIINAEIQTANIVISIKDNGIGMDSFALNRLFKIDSHRSTPGTANESGTGLGLILCKEFIEINGGNIWAESKIDIGTEFFFTVPFAID